MAAEPVSKRLRFEVLRRDGHRCRYCGAAAPDAKITVDHVVPRALGGSNDPENLVAACHDCNAGKASSAPSEPIVAQVSAEAQRWAAALEQASAESLAAREEVLDEVAPFDAEWNRWQAGPPEARRSMPLPPDYAASIVTFLRSGLPMERITDLVAVTMNADNVADTDAFRYFCGCCWNVVREIQARAEEIASQRPQATEIDLRADPLPAPTGLGDTTEALLDRWMDHYEDEGAGE